MACYGAIIDHVEPPLLVLVLLLHHVKLGEATVELGHKTRGDFREK